MLRLIGFLVFGALVFQLFLRYEHWPSDEKSGAVYERDRLTGSIQLIKQGERPDLLAKLFNVGKFGQHSGRYFESLDRPGDRAGDHPEKAHDSSYFAPYQPDAVTEQAPSAKDIEKSAQPVPVPKEVVIASSAPPVPMAMMALDIDDAHAPFAVRQVDLNRDGSVEEIIQNAIQSDGLLDISIVKNGQEIFYGRGKQIALLPNRSNEGWSDIALKTESKGTQVYRYSAKDAIYKLR